MKNMTVSSKRPKGLKLGGEKGGKRQRLASFFSAKFGRSGDDLPSLPVSSPSLKKIPPISSSEDEFNDGPAPERLQLDLGPSPSRLSIQDTPGLAPIQVSLSMPRPASHLKSGAID